ncbi:MAG: hypothetical protein OIN90_02680 [Candidatus Methanoperedens sp.]|nr:hypothetical protein [Candidatus Methanoperedens sp.]
MSLETSKQSELEDLGKTLVKFRSIRDQNNIAITGKPWIDGIIWGRSSPLSLSKIRLNITYMPAPMIEKILNELNKEYEIDILKTSSEIENDKGEILPISDIGTETVYMYISSNDPIFRNLPRTRGERRISNENNIEFIEGYLQSIMHYRSKNELRIYPVQTTREDILKILIFLQIEFIENPSLLYIKNPMSNTNPIIKRYLTFIEDEENFFKLEELSQDELKSIKESIDFSENRLKKKKELLKKRKLIELSDDELLKIIFDKSNRLKRRALEEIKYRNNSRDNISEAIKTEYLHDVGYLSIERRFETEIIGILFDWNKLEILNDIHNKFIHSVNRDLAYKYVKILRRKLGRLDGWLNT